MLDPFADEDDLNSKQQNYVHIRIQQRNGKKTLTTIQGLSPELDFPKILKHFKKNFFCNGNIVEDELLGQIIQLQGDQRKLVSQFLIEQDICKKNVIKIHGF